MEIDKFIYIWNLTDKIGYIKYQFVNGKSTKWIEYRNYGEYQVIITMLNLTKPIYLVKKDGKRLLQSGVESIGEIGSFEDSE